MVLDVHEAESGVLSRPSRWRRALTTALAGLVAIGVAAGAILGVQAFVLYDAIAQIQERSGTLTAMASRLEFDGVEVALDEVADDASLAAAAASGPFWDLAAQAPILGDDLVAVGEAVAVLDELAEAARGAYAATGLASGVGVLLPHDGQFDVAAIDGVVTAFAEIDAATVLAAERIARIDRDGLLGPVRSNIDTVSRLLEAIPAQLAEAREALSVVRTVLGFEGARTTLVVLRDSAQDWASGGAPLAVAEFDVLDGRVSFVGAVAASDVVSAIDPVDATESVWGALTSQELATVPEFAPLASTLAQNWSSRTGEGVDLVVSLDTVALDAIAQFVGADPGSRPEPGAWGEASPQLQQTALADSLVAVLDSAGGASEYIDLAAELFGGRRIQAWSSHPNESILIESFSTISGAVEPSADRIGVYLDGQDPASSGALELAVELTSCADESTVRVDVSFAAARRDTTVWVVGPTGSHSVDAETRATLDGAPVGSLRATPGESASVTFRTDALNPAYVVIAPSRLLGPLVGSTTACE